MNKYGINGEFFWEIVDEKTGKVESKSPIKKNLILNQGLNLLINQSFVDTVSYCAVSSNNTPPLNTDTGLVNEFARTNILDTSITNYAFTNLIGNIYSFTRVFKFPTTINPAFYGTIGWSYTGVVGNNLFSKSLILDANGNANVILLNQGKYLRVYYTINITLNPSIITFGLSNIVGIINDGGSYGIQFLGLKKLNNDGTIGFWDSGHDANELYSQAEIFVGTNNSGLSSFGSSLNRLGSTNYTVKSSNSYFGNGVLLKQGNFGKNNAVNTGLYSIGIGPIGNSPSGTSFAFIFNTGQSKGASNLLSTQFFYNVVRM